ncbi:MAG: hypothetical protein DI623_07710 [Sphingomonas sanxanigenens]|uniref:ABC-2 type transporter transmembrane domain-containing protein n=1 Tax=Sphingomonas sanxanigenens TaxID=397260 RepID=A0A2W5AA64_9SPHN|nr:MAG: hypothetical protein DI623_07710 [Sphingomonas sanxanigenens]
MIRFLKQSLVIARRDFTAIVFTPTFLLFLFGPLLMIGFATIGGLGAAHMAEGGAARAHVAIVLNAGEAVRAKQADGLLRPALSGQDAPPLLTIHPPTGDAETQLRAILRDGGPELLGGLGGTLDRPVIMRRTGEERAGAYLAALARTARAPAAAPRIIDYRDRSVSPRGRQSSGFGAVFAMFFLTLLLAGQSVGMLAEEKGNKVIEILAAAVPLESVFLGKLVGMFGVAMLFIAFWATIAGVGLAHLPGGVDLLREATPAVGAPAFALLFLIYFTLAFLLLGAVFLGVGAQAGTMREIQMLSLPITFFQVGMFGLASAAAGDPGSMIATVARIVPFSSPFAMAARAMAEPGLAPHLIAIAWQLLWVALSIAIGARLFRRGVLKSGGGGHVRAGRAEAAPAGD